MKVSKPSIELRRSPTVIPIVVATHTNEISKNNDVASTGLEALTQSSIKVLRVTKEVSHLIADRDNDIPIPKIVFVGDQSAGKSSIVEALTGIRIPRGEGTCTRCPLEINISDEPGGFVARVFVLKRWSYDSHEIDRNSNFPGWSVMATPIKTHVLDVSNKEDVAYAIRLAQHAILNPGDSPTIFLNYTSDDLTKSTQVPFSPNSVYVEVKGAESQTALSFIDLPGIVSSTQDNDPLIPVLVKNLANYFIRDPYVLVALVVSMTYDIEVSHSYGLVKAAGAIHRTIGVLTKPDTLNKKGKQEQWQKVLSGDIYHAGHGYYVTKQPHSITTQFEDARKEEMDFLQGEVFEKAGLASLAVALSTWLMTTIQKRLPLIASMIRHKLEESKQRLQAYPEPHADARQEARDFLNNFNALFVTFISQEALDQPNIVWQQWELFKANFEKEVLETLRPKCTVKIDLVRAEKPNMANLLSPFVSPSRELGAPTTPRKRQFKEDDNSGGESRCTSVKRKLFSTPQSGSSTPKGKAWSLGEIRDYLDNRRHVGMPNGVNVAALASLMTKTLENWQGPSEKLLSNLEKFILKSVGEILQQEVYDRWRGTELMKEAEKSTRSEISSTTHKFKTWVIQLMMLETSEGVVYSNSKQSDKKPPVFEVLTEQHLKELQEGRMGVLVRDRYKRFRVKSGEAVNEEEMDLVKMKVFLAKKEPEFDAAADPFEREVKVMAKMKAYYQYAATRYVEYITMGIQKGLMDELRGIGRAISRAIALEPPGQDEQLHILLSQDPERAKERELEVAKAEGYRKALEQLQELGDFDEDNVDVDMGEGEEDDDAV